jgi:nucleotidyltransferase/DNA polymerase involved in DNA repair
LIARNIKEYINVKALLCSQTDSLKALGIGKTKLGELISDGVLETVWIGRRRLVTIRSLERLAGIEPEQREVV